MAGCIDINASDKAARFIRTCDCFNVPLLSIADVPGYMPGTNQEYGGIIRHGAKMIYAWAEATVPKIVMAVGKVVGGARPAMCSWELRPDFIFAWVVDLADVFYLHQCAHVVLLLLHRNGILSHICISLVIQYHIFLNFKDIHKFLKKP